MEIVFKNYDLENDLDFFNIILAKASKDRFELRISKNNIYYLYDYDYREITRNKKEIKDIIDCQYLEDFVNNKNYNRILRVLNNLMV